MHTQTKCTAALHCQLHMCGGHHWQLAQGDWCIVVRPNPLPGCAAARAVHGASFKPADWHACMCAFNELRLGGGGEAPPPLTGWQGVPPMADGLMGCGPVGAHQH